MRFNFRETAMTQVQDIMTRGVCSLSPSDSVVQAARAMDELNVGAIPVCKDGELLGMVTDRDITTRAVARGRANPGTTLSDVMSEHVSWCYEDQAVEDVLQQMSDWQIRRIPVVDHSQKLVGILSLGDLALRWDADRSAQGLARICEPARAHHLWPTRADPAADPGSWSLQSGSKPRNRQSDAPSRGGSPL
jgi:CBS domain-containing protein